MAPVAEGLRSSLASARFATADWPVYSNVSAAPVTAPAEARALLLTQLTSPVRWVQVVQAMAALYPGALFVEMGPGNVLTGLLKRLAPDHPAMSCGTVADVHTLLERVSA
jgi:[acyl-carrier-protein] S-malonyltransferase